MFFGVAAVLIIEFPEISDKEAEAAVINDQPYSCYSIAL